MKLISSSQPVDSDSKLDHFVDESMDKDFDMKSGNGNELIVRSRRLITDVLDDSVLSDDHMSTESQLLHSQFPSF